MHETIVRKNKISLSDYNYQRDIENRLLMAEFSTLDLAVLEEILYSSLNISLKKLAANLKQDEKKIRVIVQKFTQTGLLTLKDDLIAVDKEMRKYFETQILKFDEEFCPGMEFLHSLLRKVPIHVLPVWYAIPRTSNNILESIVEKHLLTPHIFQRYLEELNLANPLLENIVKDVYGSRDYKVRADEIIEKYDLTHPQFEEALLFLEFSLVCCLGYERQGDDWEEVVTPFHEWREYLIFLRDTESSPVTEKIERIRPEDFSFVQDMGHLLTLLVKDEMTTSAKNPLGFPLPAQEQLSQIAAKCKMKVDHPLFLPYVHQLISKARLYKLADIVDGELQALDFAKEWLEMSLESRALHFYRSPLSRLLSVALPAHLTGDKLLREAEKSVLRVCDTGWVYFDEFMKGIHIPLTPEEAVQLKKNGKNWKYLLPEYSTDEQALLKATVFEWLFELGMAATGVHKGRGCFCVTDFGRSVFGV